MVRWDQIDAMLYEITDPEVAFPAGKKFEAKYDELATLASENPPSQEGKTGFSKLFFQGGSVTFRDEVPEEKRENLSNWLRACMGSYYPKHQTKTAVCAMLVDALFSAVETN